MNNPEVATPQSEMTRVPPFRRQDRTRSLPLSLSVANLTLTLFVVLFRALLVALLLCVRLRLL